MHQLLKTTTLATALAFGTFGPGALSTSQVNAFEIVIKQPHVSKPKRTRSDLSTVRHSYKDTHSRHYAIWR